MGGNDEGDQASHKQIFCAVPPDSSDGVCLPVGRVAALLVFPKRPQAARGLAESLAADISTREAAQLEAMNADDYEAAEALEEPLRLSRIELKACRARQGEAQAAVGEYEGELRSASVASESTVVVIGSPAAHHHCTFTQSRAALMLRSSSS